MTFFVIKYIVVWALAFVAAVILNRTIWRKVLSTTAVGDAEDQFDRRCRLNGGPVSSEIHFFDDHFDSVTAKKTRSFSYKDVTKILETKEAFGVVVKADPETVGSARAMIGFPKTALEGNNTDELAEFLLERCRNMKRKKSEEVLEWNTADEKAMCVRNKVRGHIAFYIYAGFMRVVKYLTKNNTKYCVKVAKTV